MSDTKRDVKSTAVVKYVAVEMPTQFHQLQQNTDLKQPPDNWLHGNSKWESYIQNTSFGKEQFFSSIKMGHCYPDLTGEIDVVSDAENIKKLLKIPYSKSHVSMMVHRVGNTLLLDDFDVHKHLLRQQQKDWQWLRKFYYDTIAQNMQAGIKDQMPVIKKNKSRDHLQNRNMFSKFLYYSIGKHEDAKVTQEESSCVQNSPKGAALSSSSFQLLPDPFIQAENVQPEHQRTQEWTFEDIRMLVGTDIPIFGGGTHPCISLKLRNMREPINVLTGLDYWLDNLICNVPELAMCYHLDGIVQSYEIIKTEDIPKLTKSSEFSPNVIKDIAQNILSFLKSNATKEGHTYWLFKGNGDDVVKLYDLTSVCEEVEEDLANNPFTVPVGMLLYRVARNMRTNHGRKKSGTIRTLLNKCLLLLDSEVHAQIVTSAQFLLSDLYVSDNIFSPETSPENSDVDSDTEENNETPSSNEQEKRKSSTKSIDVQMLCLPDRERSDEKQGQDLVRYPPVSGNKEEKCVEALKHIALGLTCLDCSIQNDQKSQGHRSRSKLDPDDVRLSHNPDVAIPLHYTPLNVKSDAKSSKCSSSDASKTAGAALRCSMCDSELTSVNNKCFACGSSSSSQVSLFRRGTLPSGSWHARSKALLLRKAAIAYHGLAESHLTAKKLGCVWRFVNLALRCFSAVSALCDDLVDNNLLASILSITGDLHLAMARDPQKITDQKFDFDGATKQDEAILTSAKLQHHDWEFDWLQPFTTVVHENLETSRRCYQTAVQETEGNSISSELFNNTTKRLGNINNELGVHYMNAFAKLMSKANTNKTGMTSLPPDAELLYGKSLQCFVEGISHFKKLSDPLNVALLYSNQGRLLRLVAQEIRHLLDAGSQHREFSPKEAQSLTKAQECYQAALTSLRLRDRYSDIWDSIMWEYSTTCFTMATLLQDHAPLTTKAQEQVEENVVRLMLKALDYCSIEADSPRLVTCQYRAATIHHRLASLFHNAYRNLIDSKKLRDLRGRAEDHYVKAAAMFEATESSCELIRVQLERVALYEYQLSNQTSSVTRMRTLGQALQVLRMCRSAVDTLREQLSSDLQTLTPTDASSSNVKVEGEKLLTIFVSRLQFVSLNLVKNISGLKCKKSTSATLVDTYKKMYALTLKTELTDSTASLQSRCHKISVALHTLDDLCGQISHIAETNFPEASDLKPTSRKR